MASQAGQTGGIKCVKQHMPLIIAGRTAEENSLRQRPQCLHHTGEAGLFEQAPSSPREKAPAKTF